MPQDPVMTRKRLTEIWESEKVPVLETKRKKYAIISDLHLGDKQGADNFRYNESALKAALVAYEAAKYELILLGDIEEFWQFDLDAIKEAYDSSIYSLVRNFGDERVHRVFGNHDREWSDPADPAKGLSVSSGKATEALTLNLVDRTRRILLVHGHQGSLESDKTSWFSRFFVKLYAQTVEPLLDWLGFKQERSATKSAIATDYERIIYDWAKEKKTIVICGHSHRAMFGAKSHLESLRQEFRLLQVWMYANRSDKRQGDMIKDNLHKMERLQQMISSEEAKKRNIDPVERTGLEPKPCYFNCGCGLYTDGVTVLEIEEDEIRLVKWNNDGTKDPDFAQNVGSLSTYAAML